MSSSSNLVSWPWDREEVQRLSSLLVDQND